MCKTPNKRDEGGLLKYNRSYVDLDTALAACRKTGEINEKHEIINAILPPRKLNQASYFGLQYPSKSQASSQEIRALKEGCFQG